jgi:hypothetical protein
MPALIRVTARDRARTTAMVSIAALIATFANVAPARAGDKEECAYAYDKSQELRDARKLLESRALLRMCSQPTCAAFVVKDCTAWLEDVELRIPTVVLAAKNAAGEDLFDVKVSIDGAGVAKRLDGRSLEVNPGEHDFVFDHEGFALEKHVAVAEGAKNQRVEVNLGMAEPSTPPTEPAIVQPNAASHHDAGEAPRPGDSGRRTAGLVIGGVGLAGLVVGGIFGGLAFSDWGQVKGACGADLSGCPGGASPMGATTNPSNDRNHALTFGTISDVGFIAGGVLVVGGLVLYLTAPKVSVGVGPAPGGVAAVGAF